MSVGAQDQTMFSDAAAQPGREGVRVRGAPGSDARSVGDSLERADAIARLMDTAFRVPGTEIRFGLDPIIGMIPVVGDAAGAAAGLSIVAMAHRAGAPRRVVLRMLWNLAVDGVLGLVPVLGLVVDTKIRANTRNARLFRETMRAGDSGG